MAAERVQRRLAAILAADWSANVSIDIIDWWLWILGSVSEDQLHWVLWGDFLNEAVGTRFSYLIWKNPWVAVPQD